MITLSDVTEFIRNGASIKQEKGCGGLPITRIETISNNVFNYDKMGYADINDDKYKDYYLKNYDVLLSHINSVKYLGRAVIYKQIDENPIIHGMNLLCLRFDLQKYNPEFFCYYSRSNIAKMYIANNTKKSVNQASITATAIKNMPIPDLSLELQSSIVDRLNKLQNIIELKNEQISKLDELVKSQFVEMFGDYSINPNKFKIDKLESHIDVLSGYPFESTLYVEEGINICGGLIIMPNYINWNECKHWSTTKGFEEYTLCENDIVMALDRPWISEGFKIAKIDKAHLPALLIQRTARIRGTDINQEYLYYCFENCGFDNFCNITGSLVPHISLKDIKSFSVMLPPIDLQNQFADFVAQVDKQKATIKKSLKKLETLKKSLMQEYFG